MRTNITGAILAGGRSSRMGRDKALLDLDGVPFIERVAHALKSVFDEVLVISDHAGQYAFLNLPIFVDGYKNCGPLAGIHSALINATKDAIFVASCDIPFLTPSFIREVIAHDGHCDVTLVFGSNSLEPLCGLYRKTCLPVVERQLRKRKYAVRACLQNLQTTILTLPPKAHSNLIHPLTNINTPNDYEHCQRTARHKRHL